MGLPMEFVMYLVVEKNIDFEEYVSKTIDEKYVLYHGWLNALKGATVINLLPKEK